MSLTSALNAAPPQSSVLQAAGQGSTSYKASSSKWQQSAENALTTLKQLASQSDQHAAAKAAAAQKLALLKAQLKTLEMFGTDPKNKAQEAARIAREIGDAAKEYAQAGGSTNAVTALSSTAPSPVAADVVVSSSTDTAASTQSKPAPATASTPSSTSDPTAALSSNSNGQTDRSSSRSADLTFISEARLLARKAKAVLQSAAQAAARKKENTGGISADGDKALSAIDTAAFTLGLDRGADPSAGYGATAQSVSPFAAASIQVTA